MGPSPRVWLFLYPYHSDSFGLRGGQSEGRDVNSVSSSCSRAHLEGRLAYPLAQSWQPDPGQVTQLVD